MVLVAIGWLMVPTDVLEGMIAPPKSIRGEREIRASQFSQSLLRAVNASLGEKSICISIGTSCVASRRRMKKSERDEISSGGVLAA